MIRVLVADDEALIRTGLEMIISLQDDLDVVGTAQDGDDVIAMARDRAPDVVLMDIRMPGTDGLAATRAITALPSRPRVVILTTFALDEYIDEALGSGAVGYLLKDTPPRELVEAIRVVARGDAFLSPAVTRRLIEARRQLAAAAAPCVPKHTKELERLTDREREVLVQLAHGMSNAQIARTLHMSEGTVKGHASRLMAKLGVANRVQAALTAYEAGLVGSTDNSTADGDGGGSRRHPRLSGGGTG